MSGEREAAGDSGGVGSAVALRRRRLACGCNFSERLCGAAGAAEFAVERRFPVRSWILCASALYAVGIAAGLEQQDIAFLVSGLVLCTLLLLVRLHLRVTKESLVALAGFGVQVSSSSFFGRKCTAFFPCDAATDDFLVHETLGLWTVSTSLALLKRSPDRDPRRDRVLPLFRHSCLRLDCIAHMYRRLLALFEA